MRSWAQNVTKIALRRPGSRWESSPQGRFVGGGEEKWKEDEKQWEERNDERGCSVRNF